MATIVSLLEQKCNEESSKLKRKIEIQLKKDIYRIFSESLFSDIVVNVDSKNSTVKLHRCIFQTRAPVLYSLYCSNPNLIGLVPVQKLELFFKDVYTDSEIGQKEEEILKYIDSVFTFEKRIPSSHDASSVESSGYFHFNTSFARSDTATTYFQNGNNAAYYSLVDESLLSDFSDIHEEACKDMNNGGVCDNSLTQNKPNETDTLVPSSEVTVPVGKHCAAETHAEPPKKESKQCTFFIDASELTDEGEASLGDLRSLNSEPEKTTPEVHVRRRPAQSEQTPDSLDDDPYNNNGDQNSTRNEERARKLETDFLNANKNRNGSNGELLRTLYPEVLLEVSFSDKVRYSQDTILESQPTTEALRNFKNYLMQKYESLKSGNNADCAHLNMFDELIAEDKQLLLLKYNLEEILSSRLATNTEIAEHKFLYHEYEKKHGKEKTYNFIKSFAVSVLQKARRDSVTPSVEKYDQTPDSLNEEETSKSNVSIEYGATNGDSSAGAAAIAHEETVTENRRKKDAAAKSYGFFIDLKDNQPVKDTIPKRKAALPAKQLFSMFIDLGNSTDSDSSVEVQNKLERRKKQYLNKLEKSRELRNSVSSLNESTQKPAAQNAATTPPRKPTTLDLGPSADGAAVTRRNKSTLHSAALRRSWNVDKLAETSQNASRHKRSYSVSSEKDIAASAAPPPVDCNNGDAPVKAVTQNEFPSIGNADSTNELTANGGESEVSSRSYSEQDKENFTPCNSNANTVDKKSSRKTDQNENYDEKPPQENNDFVKLSDMDKEPKVPVNADRWQSVRMTKSATSTENWFETRLLSGSANSRSLSRIFPDLSANILSKPNSDVDDTTVSSISSVQSSSAVSTCESNLEVSNLGSKKENNTLGQDLLKMFVDEISPDVVIEVTGRRIKAHKCILTSRCQYFAALLSGGWVESAGNVLSIHGFSYSVVHFALCYIYSGESEIPENINIVELATLADMLCLEGLKEVVSHNLKMKYCHFFHKPCNVCSVGVLECLPIAINYGLDDIHRKGLRWITKHFVRLWCTKAFATLPRELIEKCYNQHVVNMTVNNVFETVMNCDKLFSSIPQTRWAEPCFLITRRLHDHSIKYLANNFSDFLKSDSFSSIAKNRSWGILIMEEKTQLTCGKMRPEQMCQSYAYLCKELKSPAATENEEFVVLLTKVKNQIETALVRNALQASQNSAWFQMETELRNHIQGMAGLTLLPGEIKRRMNSFKPRPSSVPSTGSRTLDLQQVKSAINRHQRPNNVPARNESKQSTAAQKHVVNGQAKNPPARQNGSQTKSYKGSTAASSKSPFRNKYANVKSRYMDRRNSKDKATSETTPSETSEAEKKPPSSSNINQKRPSKSLVSSAHLSPGIRESARAVSLSKIPVSLRHPSQKRNESDRDTTSESEHSKQYNGSAGGRKSSAGARAGAGESNTRRAVSSAKATPHQMSRSMSSATASKGSSGGGGGGGPSRRSVTSLVASTKSGRGSRGVTSEERMSKSHSRTNVKTKLNGVAKRKNVQGECQLRPDTNDNFDDDDQSKNGDSGDETQEATEITPSTETSISESMVKPNIPFRRDGTFCIDEPTVLKRQSPSKEKEDVV